MREKTRSAKYAGVRGKRNERGSDRRDSCNEVNKCCSNGVGVRKDRREGTGMRGCCRNDIIFSIGSKSVRDRISATHRHHLC